MSPLNYPSLIFLKSTVHEYCYVWQSRMRPKRLFDDTGPMLPSTANCCFPQRIKWNDSGLQNKEEWFLWRRHAWLNQMSVDGRNVEARSRTYYRPGRRRPQSLPIILIDPWFPWQPNHNGMSCRSVGRCVRTLGGSEDCVHIVGW